MVNYGASQGCDACKKRRKKCDETRPACNRCIKSQRTCPGYKDETKLIFRHYEPPKVAYKTPVCWWSPLVEDEKLEEAALDIFVAEFVVESADRDKSRGFLDGMQFLLKGVDPDSGLAIAAKLVVLASIGNRSGRKSLIQRTERQYGTLLRTYHHSLSLEAGNVSIESLYTAVFLGFYEMIVTNESAALQHLAHVRGVCAILSGRHAPSDLKAGVRMFQTTNLLHKSALALESQGILCVPISHDCLNSLDITLAKHGYLINEADQLLAQDSPSLEKLAQLEQAALILLDEFIAWAQIETPLWSPVTFGVVHEAMATISGCAYCHSGPIHTYTDYYIATVWNTFRKSQIRHIDLVVRLARLLSHEDTIPQLEDRARKVVSDVISSIPYHLAYDMDQYLKLVEGGAPAIPPNRPIGGLLLLHPIYAVARCSVVSLPSRMYLSKVLAWIGENMGIGQATLLAQSMRLSVEKLQGGVETWTLPLDEISNGHILIWAGMLLQPA